MKLERALARFQLRGKKRARLALEQQKILVDHTPTSNPSLEVSRFSRIQWDTELVQPGEPRHLIALHKPAGILSARSDANFTTVLDLLPPEISHNLHLCGRLDRATTGLILLTNDGNISKHLSLPDRHITKHYLVTTHQPIPDHAPQAFTSGFYFPTENILTRPAILKKISNFSAHILLQEGRYHQIKRMLHRLGCTVASLHRQAIGPIKLPPHSQPGDFFPVSLDLASPPPSPPLAPIPLDVVCAIILNQQGQFLACRRAPNRHLEGLWELPGGKINPLESPSHAISRELHEELSIHVTLHGHLQPTLFPYPNHLIRLLPFFAKISHGTPTLTDHDALQWLSPQHWNHLPWAPADIPILQQLQNIPLPTADS